MRISNSQTDLLVTFMESHGDLSKPSSSPQGKISNNRRWGELTSLLNADATGEEKTNEKWKRAWSDLKNNTKRKAAKIAKSARGTGGGPPSKLKLTDVEQRILNIINPRAATGDDEIVEVGLQMEQEEPSPPPQAPTSPPAASPLNVIVIAIPDRSASTQHYDVDDFNVAGSSQDPPTLSMTRRNSPAPATPPRRPAPYSLLPALTRQTRRQMRSPVRPRNRPATRQEQAAEHFLKADQEWRESQAHQERERIRIRELEIQMQTRWQDLFADLLLIIGRYFNNKNN